MTIIYAVLWVIGVVLNNLHVPSHLILKTTFKTILGWGNLLGESFISPGSPSWWISMWGLRPSCTVVPMSTAFVGSLLIQSSQKQNWFAFEKMSYAENPIQEDDCDLPLLCGCVWDLGRGQHHPTDARCSRHCLVPMMASMEFPYPEGSNQQRRWCWLLIPPSRGQEPSLSTFFGGVSSSVLSLLGWQMCHQMQWERFVTSSSHPQIQMRENFWVFVG